VFDSNDKQSRRLYQILAVAPTTWAMVDVIDESLMFCFLDLKKKIFLEQAKFSLRISDSVLVLYFKNIF
jgi:hypothetical protein